MSLLKAILYQSMLAVLLLTSHFALSAQPAPDRGYQLKAIFLYNFTQFVEWPSNSFSSEQSPMIIGVLGTDPFGDYLEETIAGEKINGHPLQVKYYKDVEEIAGCQVLFINLPETKRQQALAKLKGKNILTVSDDPDFMRRGGMIRFYTKEGKIKLQVNLEATKTESLVLSSKLLRLVEIFTPQKG
jgi:hypothetical protein